MKNFERLLITVCLEQRKLVNMRLEGQLGGDISSMIIETESEEINLLHKPYGLWYFL